MQIIKERYDLLINGKLQPAVDGRYASVCNPADESVIASVAIATVRDAELAVESAKKCFEEGIWAKLSPSRRSWSLQRLANLIEEQENQLTELLIMETGSTFGKAQVEIKATIEGLRTYSELAVSGYEYPTSQGHVGTTASLNMVRRVPVGVTVGIVPWNWPLYLTMWKMAPALAVGNSVIIKVPNHACLTVLMLAELSLSAEIPPGVLQIINGEGPSVGEYLVKHKSVNMISFTGSTETGKRVMMLGANTLKRLTLELGGKSAQIFLEDADLDMAIDGALFSGYNHAGQTCHNGTRLLVPDTLHDEIVERLVRRTKDIRIGNPLLDRSVGMGPVNSKKHLEAIQRCIQMGLHEGARIAVGGHAPPGEDFKRGYWISPTILTGVTNTMWVAREEIFGPVLVVIAYRSLDEAISIANDSSYGLAGNIWSRRLDQAMEVAKQIQTGTVWINDASLVNIHAPFGGFKQSGIGRESGIYGLISYTELQHIHIGLSEKKPYLLSLFPTLGTPD